MNRRAAHSTPSPTTRTRLNWGHVLKLPPAEQIPIVQGWVDSHQPSDPGYQQAMRWLLRREFYARNLARSRPTLERMRQDEARRTEHTNPQHNTGDPQPWGIFVDATPRPKPKQL